MKIRFSMLAAVLALVVVAAAASAQDAQKIAIANPGRIIDKMQERADSQVALDNYLKGLSTERDARQKKVDDLKRQRADLKADSPQFAAKTEELLRESIEFNAWLQLSQLEAQRRQKMMMVSLYNKVMEGIRKIADKEKFDLVLSEQAPEVPDNLEAINPDQLRGILASRNVLFNSGKTDITQQVIDLLNLEYSAKAPPKNP